MGKKGFTIYDDVYDYLRNFKVGDRIVLAGCGIVDGITTIQSKHDTYTVTERTNSTHLSLKAYKKKAYLSLSSAYYYQQIAVISTETFKDLLD